MIVCRSLFTLALLMGLLTLAAPPLTAAMRQGTGREPARAQRSLPGAEVRTSLVDGVPRKWLYFAGTTATASAPVVFVFHGHGGSHRGAATRYEIHRLWPEALVVYPQGLVGATTRLDPEGRRPGWQNQPGEQGDRDVRLVDQLLAELQGERAIDPDRIYAFGHSNGARFSNVLWNMRGDTFAAFASAAAQGGQLLVGAPPRSLFMLMGENDPIVPIAGQMLTVPVARRTVGADPSQAVNAGHLRVEPGAYGAELAMYIHPGGHEIPAAALPLIVEFLQRHTRPVEH